MIGAASASTGIVVPLYENTYPLFVDASVVDVVLVDSMTFVSLEPPHATSESAVVAINANAIILFFILLVLLYVNSLFAIG